MASTFSVDKPKDFQSMFNQLRANMNKLSDTGIRLEGDEYTGTVYAQGVVADYITGTETINITIRKKPALFPQKAVENEIKKLFQML